MSALVVLLIAAAYLLVVLFALALCKAAAGGDRMGSGSCRR